MGGGQCTRLPATNACQAAVRAVLDHSFGALIQHASLTQREMSPAGCVRVCRLNVQCSSNLSTADLEAEVFLHVLHNCVEYVQAEGDPDPRSAASVAYADGDGMTRCEWGVAVKKQTQTKSAQSQHNSVQPGWAAIVAATELAAGK